MKKRLLIFFALITLFSLVVETGKSFFNDSAAMEMVEKKDTEEGDSGKSLEKNGEAAHEKYFATETFLLSCIISKDRFYISHTALLPASYNSVLEIPPEQV